MPANRDTSTAESEQIKPEGSQERLPDSWWSVDPGEKHVGMAYWCRDELLDAEETTPLGLQDYLLDSPPRLLVIEAFSLMSPRWTQAKGRQAVETIKLIGAAHAIMRMHGERVVEQQPSVRHVAQASPWWRQLAAEGLIPANAHARSAAAHGLYYARFSRR